MRFSIGQTPRAIAKRQEAVAKERRKLREREATKDAPPTAPAPPHSGLPDLASANARFGAATFAQVLFKYLAKTLGLGKFMDEYIPPDALPWPSGTFEVVLTLADAPQLRVECKHAGGGVITLAVGAERMRCRLSFDATYDGPVDLEIIDGTPEGDPRWLALTALAKRRQRRELTEAQWISEIAAVLGIDLTVSPEAEALAQGFRESIRAAGFDEDRLLHVAEQIQASPLRDFMQQELIGEIDDRRDTYQPSDQDAATHSNQPLPCAEWPFATINRADPDQCAHVRAGVIRTCGYNEADVDREIWERAISKGIEAAFDGIEQSFPSYVR